MSFLKRSIFTQEGLAFLHGRRQGVAPTEGNRSASNLGLAIFFVITLMMALSTLMWVQRDEVSFLKSLSGVTMLDAQSLEWRVYADSREIYVGSDLRSLENKGKSELSSYYLETRLSRAAWADLSDKEPVVIVLHPFVYDSAVVTIDGSTHRTYYNSERLILKIRPENVGARDIGIGLTLSVKPTQPKLLAGQQETDLIYVAPESRHRKYEEMAAAARSGHGKQLADIARVVLAVFCLLLFIFVDSSPESLGLCLFMGLKGIGVVFSQNWLPESWAGATGISYFRGGLLCFGDIMQFYFFTQLARVARPRLKLWFMIGIPLAILYALTSPLSNEVWRWRNVLIGLACQATALTSAAYLYKKGLYYRSAALLIACSGTIVQVVVPLAGYFPGVTSLAWFKTFYNVMETHTPYVFALSTFINLTTLENRVKSLSRELVNAKEIEREMALGKTVQQSFLRLPEVPEGLEVICAHEAALYVSGDIYFVHWDEGRRTLTLLINDVTGHGVQAALKASICTTIADSIWNEGQVRANDQPASRFRTYDMRLHSFLSKVANQSEVVALVGGELNLETGTLALYRVNGIFPLVIEPNELGDGWNIRVVPVRNREAMELTARVGTFAVFISDGYIDNSRTMNHFHTYLGKILAGFRPGMLTGAILKAKILEFGEFATTGDDKTLLVLGYRHEVAFRSAQEASVA